MKEVRGFPFNTGVHTHILVHIHTHTHPHAGGRVERENTGVRGGGGDLWRDGSIDGWIDGAEGHTNTGEQEGGSGEIQELEGYGRMER